MDWFGNVWMTGYTSSRLLPATHDAVQLTFGGGKSDAFLAGENYLSYLGGSGDEAAPSAPRTRRYR